MGSPTSDGLGAFVRLDYNTNTEHAIVLMAKEWGSLKDFIATPGIFIENWRSKYGSTPDHKHLKFDSKIWELEGPITFIIEPLTVPTSSNAMTLASLDPLYPGLGAVARKWMTTTPEKFLNNVMAEISAPYTSWDTGETGYVAGMAPFTFAYIAEFAIKTRTITIKYIPRTDVNTPTYSHLDITSITVNHVK